MNEQDFAELAAGHALNALSPADESAFEAALQEHPEWEHIVRADAATVAGLSESVLDVAPPIALRSRLLSMIATTPQGSMPPEQRPQERREIASGTSEIAGPETASHILGSFEPATDTHSVQAISRRRWTRGLFALAASLVLLIALGFGAAFVGQQLNTPASVVALNQIEDAPDAQAASVALEDGGQATVHWSESVGKTVLVSDGLPTLTADQQFELWYVRDGSAVSAGLFDAGSDGEVTALLDGSIETGDTVAVTVEAQGGSVTGEPTTDPIIAIPTA